MKFKMQNSKALAINNLINEILFIFVYIVLFTFISTNAVAESNDIKEYGIVILPEDKCSETAKNLNNDIAKILTDLQNVPNHWHVTLYHGAYTTRDLEEIYNKLKALPLKPFNLTFTKIYSTSDRWIDLGTEKTEYLQQLHQSIVQLASPYHKRPLNRAADIYNDQPVEIRKQINSYGVSGVLELYNPHMTLFYQYPPNVKLQEAAKKIESKVTNNLICKAAKIIIGELGYNGNIEKITYNINIPN